MRISVLLGVLIVAGCQDPFVSAKFAISPLVVPPADSTVLVESRQVAEAFAQEYRLQVLRPYPRCPIAMYSGQDSLGSREIGLTLCVRSEQGVTVFELWQGLTSHWGQKGNALRTERTELLDTLRNRFGAAAVTAK